MQQADLVVRQLPVAVASPDERPLILPSATHIGGLAERTDLRDVRYDDMGALERDDLDLTPDRRMHIVGARPGKRFSRLHRVEPRSRAEPRSLVQPQDHRAARAIAERAERLAQRLRQLPDRRLDLDGMRVRPRRAKLGH